jgi:hypothetical protein
MSVSSFLRNYSDWFVLRVPLPQHGQFDNQACASESGNIVLQLSLAS